MQEQKTTNQEQRLTYPSYLDLLTEDQFIAFEKGIRLAREEKKDEAIEYFNKLVTAYADQPNMFSAVCIVLADLGKQNEAEILMQDRFEAYKGFGMYLCALARIQLLQNKLDDFEKTFNDIKVWLQEREAINNADKTRDQQIEHAVVFAEAAYLGVRYCISKKSLGQAAFLIKEYEEIMPQHDMFLALKVFLAHALQEALPHFRLPPHQHEFEPFMNHVITQIIEQNTPKEEQK